MEPTFLSSLPLWVINLSLGGLVYVREPRKASHRAFAAYVLTMVAWSVCVKMTHAYALHPSRVVWARLAFVTAGLIGQSFVVFCQVFPDQRRLELSRGARMVIRLGIVATALASTPLVLNDIRASSGGGIQPHYGPFYPLFGGFMLVAFGHGIWTLTRKWRAAHGRGKQQMRYLWLGLCLGISGGITTNLIIPALTHTSRFSGYGPYFTLVFVGLTAHAIIRHRLMDIRLVIRQSVTYSLSLGITGGVMWGILTIVGPALGWHSPFGTPALPLFIGIGSIIAFHPIQVALQRLLDRYCYREPYDYRRATRTMSQVLADLVRMVPLCEYLVSFIHTTLKVEGVAVYLCHEGAVLKRCASQSTNDDWHFPSTLSAPEVIALLARAGEPIVRDELRLQGERREAECLAETFAFLHSEVMIPLLVKEQVAGVIAVGGKLSSDPFFTHDLEFLTTVGHQASVALRRAQLYEEITWMKEYSESILRQMRSGVIAVDYTGVITMINAAAARLIGVVAAEVANKHVTEAIPEELHTPLLHTLTESLTYADQEITLRLASGRLLPIAVSTSVLHGAEGEPAGAILVFHDLSRLKELEEEKRRIERLASIGTFVSGIAHEIKNPLVAIRTLAELLPEQYDDREFRETFTKVALHEVERIDTLVRRLRSLGASSPLQMRPISILTPLEETLALLSGELAKRHITVVYEDHKSLPLVMGDVDQLKQVFLNLCLNSIEAMEKDGVLRIAVSVDKPHDGTPAVLLVQISDTGPGIPADDFPTIFEPFVTSKDTGSGLGLAICKGIVEYHRGTIHAANHLDGPGATFTVRLPVAHGENAYEVTTPPRRYAPTADAVA
jgi:PAS domain S-box-containing protein